MSTKNKLIIFRLNNQQFALHLSIVEKIVRIVEVSPLPKAPNYIMGVIDYKGSFIPVINVRKLFGLSEKEIDLDDQLIIANTSMRTVALWVDTVREVIERDDQEISHAERIFVGVKFIEGIFRFEDGIVLIHNLDKFITQEENALLQISVEDKPKETKKSKPQKQGRKIKNV